MSLTTDRIEELSRQVLDPSVHGMLVDASEIADLLVRARELAECQAWMRRAVCFIGAAGQDEQAAESADELIFSAHVLLTTGGRA